MPDRINFVGLTGVPFTVRLDRTDIHPDRDVDRVWYELISAGEAYSVCVQLIAPRMINVQLQNDGLPPYSSIREKLALLALLRSADSLDSLRCEKDGTLLLDVDSQSASIVLQGRRISDGEIRRFIARRMYDEYTRGTLHSAIVIDDNDFALAGAHLGDFVRNAEVLEEEGYLITGARNSTGLMVTPTASLIRDVERYGAARPDVISEQDYLGSLGGYPVLGAALPTISLEYRRYATATTRLELMSVFRAIAPVVEEVLRNVLKGLGVKAGLPNLGAMISAFEAHPACNAAALAQLRHILKFARDVSQHGGEFSEPALRIVCETAFALIPQLASSLPR